jgi:hypothetical protein
MHTRSSGKEIVNPFLDPNRIGRKSRRRVQFSEVEGSSDLGINMGDPNPPPADPFDAPMINRTRNVARTPGSAIVHPRMGDDFSVKGHHLKMIQENVFDGIVKSDPHKHISEFVDLCNMFKYGNGLEEGVKIVLFPSSLTGEAKTWFNELEPGSLRTWEELREAFVNRFFPPALARKLLNQIRSFRQYDNETLTDAWIRLKELLRNCHGHGLDRGQHVDIFYEGLNHQSQHDLDLAGGGNFQYKSPNEVFRMMEDLVVAKTARDRVNRDRRNRESVNQVSMGDNSSGSNSGIVNELRNLTDKFDKRMTRLENDVYVVRNENVGQPEDVSYLENRNENWGYQRGNYNQNRYDGPRYGGDNTGSSSRPQNQSWKREENDPELKEMIKTLIHTQNAGNEGVKNSIKVINDQMRGLNDKIEQNQRNQQASLQDLERRFDRMNSRYENRPTGQIPSNTQPNPRPPQNPQGNNNQGRYQPPPVREENVSAIMTRSGLNTGRNEQQNEETENCDGNATQSTSELRRSGTTVGETWGLKASDATQSTSELRRNKHTESEKFVEDGLDGPDEVEVESEVEMEIEEPKQAEKVIEHPEIKAYKPKIPYPQRLRQQKMKASYGKFCDMIKNVNINVPLVDLISGMPDYTKFMKELISSKGKMEEVQAMVLNAECSSVVQNGRIPPKLDDPGSFLLTCQFGKTFSCNALADLGASINLMPYSLYAKLALNSLKPTRISIRLADRSLQYPLGIAENMLVQVGKFVFPVDFVILEMEEDSKVPLILGRPFLNTADAIIRVKNKEISLGIGEDRMVFSVEKSAKHSYSNKKDCFSIEVIENDCETDFDVVDETFAGSDVVCKLEDDWVRGLNKSLMEDDTEDVFDECDVEAKMLELFGDDAGEMSTEKGNDGWVELEDRDIEVKELIITDGEDVFDEEIRERISEDVSELKGIEVKKINPEILDELSSIDEEPDPKDEINGKVTPKLFVNKNICFLLACRKKARGVYLRRKKCKVRWEQLLILMMLVILACTRKWMDALVQNFEKLFVTNRFCVFDDYFYLNNFYHGLD